ncbi:MAG: NAD(P)H-binding protein [Pseudomonadota bacterium]
MVVLLTGASGFLGTQLTNMLLAAGHIVIGVVHRRAVDARPGAQMRYIEADFTTDFDEADWLPKLYGVDLVINAVGIIRETGLQTFHAIHCKAPCALFKACAHAGVKRVIQISALGADDHAQSRYHLSKKAADDFLSSLDLPSVIVQPSLVYGEGGTSAKLFTILASLPLIPLPGHGQQMIQPVHVADVSATILALLDQTLPKASRIAVVGPRALTLRDFLAILRISIGLRRARFFPAPMALVRIVADASRFLPDTLLDRETLQMLEDGNTADVSPLCALLGRPPRPPEQFIPPHGAKSVRLQAQLNYLLPVLRWSIALVWIATGLVSIGWYPVADSYALLARTGISGAHAPWILPLMLYGAALLDIGLGLATVLLKRRHWVWLTQLAIILFYTAVISWRMPEFWSHPYGPLLKNIPMLAAIWLLMELERSDHFPGDKR